MKNVPVCTFKTSPCVPAPRAHVLKHVCAWCRYTRGGFERSHGDVLSGHTEFRSVSHTNTHTSTHTTHHDTTHHDHNTTRRKTETEKEDRDRERREDGRGETRQEKRRQKKTEERSEKILFSVWWCMAFFFVGVVICLVNPVKRQIL